MLPCLFQQPGGEVEADITARVAGVEQDACEAAGAAAEVADAEAERDKRRRLPIQVFVAAAGLVEIVVTGVIEDCVVEVGARDGQGATPICR